MASIVLESAIEYLRASVVPHAQEIDGDREALRKALDGLCRGDWMAMKRPAEYGGPALGEEDFRSFQEEVARASGSLAFLQTQHQSAVSMIARSANSDLKDDYLPRMGNGERLVGIGFSQLRRSGPPLMKASPMDDGYLLEGHVPWVTGWDFFREFLVGATLPDGQAVFGIVPLRVQNGVSISPPMRLAAMDSANTVTVDFQNFHLAAEKVAFIRPANWIRNNDQVNIALQGHFALGCARAGLDILRQNSEKKSLAFLGKTLQALELELEECRLATRQAQADASEETTAERLKVRAWAIDLAVRCAHAAIAASSGAANSLDHPAQRVYREALVYTVSAQTPQIMEATLDRLVRL